MQEEDNTTPRVVIVPPNRLSTFQTIEATFEALYAFFLAFIFLCLGGSVVFSAKRSDDFYWLLALWIALMVGEGAFIVWLKSSLEFGYRPFVPIFALRQYAWPILLRPIVFCWWIAHYLITVATIIFIEDLMMDRRNNDMNLAVSFAALILFVWMLTHCSLMYLFLAVTSLKRDQALVSFLWRFRMVIDIVFTSAFFAAAYLYRH